MIRFNPISLSATRLELWFYDVKLGTATGFFYRFGQDVALVTNWHVFAGRNAISNAYLDARRYTPNRVKFSLNIFYKETGVVEFRAADLPLCQDGVALWWQHAFWTKADGSKSLIDIGVLNLSSAITDFQAMASKITSLSAYMIINMSGEESDWTAEHATPRVSSEVFILGFPRGFGEVSVLPIWKRGSVASEPLYYNDFGEPVILIDALTRNGMSGAPVLYFGNDVTNSAGFPVKSETRNGEPWLIGVYAGRDGATSEENEMALSRVWRREVLDQVFFDRCPGGVFPE